MTDYARTNDFSVKDSLAADNPLKVISGADVDEEFDAIKDAVETKADSASPTFTGTVTMTGATLVGIIPPATIAPYAGSTEPAGWVFCDGSAYNSSTDTTFAALYTAIQNVYGGTDDTDFKVPDLRGRTVFGADNMDGAGGTGGGDAAVLDDADAHDLDGDTVGATGGEAEHTVTSGEMPAHTHGAGSFAAAAHTHAGQGYSTGGGGTNNMSADTTFSTGLTGGSHPATTTSAAPAVAGTSASTGGGSAMPLIPPGIVLNYIIKK